MCLSGRKIAGNHLRVYLVCPVHPRHLSGAHEFAILPLEDPRHVYRLSTFTGGFPSCLNSGLGCGFNRKFLSYPYNLKHTRRLISFEYVIKCQLEFVGVSWYFEDRHGEIAGFAEFCHGSAHRFSSFFLPFPRP